MTKDLIKRLRSQKAVDGRPHEIEQLTDEAAALIEQQADRIAALEAQIATVAPAVDAQPVGEIAHNEIDGFHFAPSVHWLTIGIGTKLYATPQSEGLRKDAWRPIETAPSGAKGYCWMNLAWGPEGDVSTGIGMRWGDRFFAAGSFYCISQEKRYEFREIEVQPTHWMPLPEAPAALSQHTGEKDD